MTTRKYEQRMRAEVAAQTRRRVLNAVYERLRVAPVEPVSVDRVAQQAGVSRSTIYLIFGSRAGLFDALGADLLDRGGFHRVMEAVERPDAVDGLRDGIAVVVQMYAAHRDVLRALHSMSSLDPDAVGGSIQRMEAGRASGMIYLAHRLADQHSLRSDVTVDEAANLLWVVTSFDSFDLLYTARALTAEQVATTLITAAVRSLCR